MATTKFSNRKCDGCGEVKLCAGTRGPRGSIKRYCEKCIALVDAGRRTPIELLAQSLPHVPRELAQEIAEVLPT